MSSKVFSAAIIGLEAEIVEVEAEIGGGELGLFKIVGLPDLAISESRERVRSAIRNSGIEFPRLKVTVNLAPAHIRKQGPRYDLPIAMSILAISRQIPMSEILQTALFVGELALSGEVRPVTGILSTALAAKKYGFKILFVARDNASEAALISNLIIIPVSSLKELIEHLQGVVAISPFAQINVDSIGNKSNLNFDMAEILGQEQAKRALEIAAAGSHNIILSGPPGSGKTILARSLISILPSPTLNEALEITKIHSIAGTGNTEQGLIQDRPFRSPHHTASAVALVGGGSWPKPGEISLAHRGILFLDEFAEFPRQVLENLRQPLEDGYITISRVAGNLIFPARFMLVAAMNPCPCGYFGDSEKQCICSLPQIMNYRKKISGPILDRIDLHINVPRIPFATLIKETSSESSEIVRQRIIAARARQLKRFSQLSYITNSEMSTAATRDYCQLDQAGKAVMDKAVTKLHISARSYFRLLKLARTIADLEATEAINVDHIAEALQYRFQEM